MGRFDRLLENSKKKGLTKYRTSIVVPTLNRVIRAEAACRVQMEPCVVNGSITEVFSPFGEVVCVTCGRVGPWTGGLDSQMFDAGHFVGKVAAIALDERNIHCQCKICNRGGAQCGNGAPHEYELFMRSTAGQAVIDELRALKRTTKQYTRHELVELYISYLDREKAAIAILQGEPQTMASTSIALSRPRQLTFSFDYAEVFAPADVEVLEGHAKQFRKTHNAGRKMAVKVYFDMASVVANAHKLFTSKRVKKGNPDDVWTEYVKDQFKLTRAEADKAIQVHKVLSKKDVDELAGLPVSMLYRICREGFDGKLRSQILKAAKDHYLTGREVDMMINGNGQEMEMKALPSVPRDHDSLKLAVMKKVNPLVRKLKESKLREEIPTVLREIADEMVKEDAA